jgi:ribonuclease Z
MFEITMLGTSSGAPTVERSLPSIAVRKDGDVYLLDCGEGAQRQMMRFGVSYMKVKAIFITHLHLDHFLGAFGLIETMALNGRAEKLTIYGPAGSKGAFGKKDFLEVVEIEDGFSLDAGEFSIFAFKVSHARDSFGFAFQEKEKVRFYEEKAHAAGLRGQMFSQLLQKGELKVGKKTVKLKDVTYRQGGRLLVYSGDTLPSTAVAKAAKGADLLIHESTFGSDREAEAAEAKHSTAAQAALIAKKAGVKKLLLTHISGRYRGTAPLLEEAKKIFPCIVVAQDGLKLEA